MYKMLMEAFLMTKMLVRYQNEYIQIFRKKKLDAQRLVAFSNDTEHVELLVHHPK